MGGAFSDTLEKKGLIIMRNKSPLATVGMLVLNRTNSAVMNSYSAEDFNTTGEYAGKLKIHKLPIRSKSYFLIFAKKGQFYFVTLPGDRTCFNL